MNVSTFKVKDGVAENVSTIYDQLPFPKLLDELVEYANREYILNSIRTVQKKTKEELVKGYKPILIGNPSPSIMDFVEHGRKMEMHITHAMGIPADYIGALGVDALSKLIASRDSEWLTCIDLMKSGFKGFDQRRKLAKRRIKQDLPFTTGKFKNFYKRYKLV